MSRSTAHRIIFLQDRPLPVAPEQVREMELIKKYVALIILFVTIIAGTAEATCPWPRNYTSLNAACLCNTHNGQEISVQCNSVDFPLLLDALKKFVGRLRPVHVLVVNDSDIGELPPLAFPPLRITSLQLSNCKISAIAPTAFQGQEETLINLNLMSNLLSDPPLEALRSLRRLSLLDLSKNSISIIPDNAFVTLKLQTLKLAENPNLEFGLKAFRGLERVLKNLNLKKTGLARIPEATANLTALTFLDLAQNNLSSFIGGLHNLHSLAALNLERNSIRELPPRVFSSLGDTLTSLSLLDNSLSEYPLESLRPLKELKVLDVGFNRIKDIPEEAFATMSSLTLLALDGNPIEALPEGAFVHLRPTLRGLSLGGEHLVCDCGLRWVVEWIKELGLQVTSRERGTGFCSSIVQDLSQLDPEDLTCEPPTTTTTTTTTTARRTPPSFARTRPTTTTFEPVRRYTTTAEPPRRYLTTTAEPPRRYLTTTAEPIRRFSTTTPPTTTRTITTPIWRITPELLSSRAPTIAAAGGFFPVTTTRPTPPSTTTRTTTKAPTTTTKRIIMNKPASSSKKTNIVTRPKQDILVTDAFRESSAVIIQWEALTAPIPGFRVVYRLFGDHLYKQGPPLAGSEREFRIKNVPDGECIVVCVVPADHKEMSQHGVPQYQCKEVRTELPYSSHYMDRIIIGASSAICVTVILAVIIFLCCNTKCKEEVHPSAGMMGGMGMMGPHGGHMGVGPRDWDAVSVCTARSIPRARMYHHEEVKGYLPPDDCVSEYNLHRDRSRRMSTRSMYTPSSVATSNKHLMSSTSNLSRAGSVTSLWQEALLQTDDFVPL